MTWNHDQTQLDLLLAGEFVSMGLVIFVHFCGRSDGVELDVLTPHRLDDHFLGLHLFELAHCEILGLERFDEGVPIPAEIGANNIVHPVLHEMVRNLVVFFFERLNNELAIDQILKCGLAHFLHLFDELIAIELGAQ